MKKLPLRSDGHFRSAWLLCCSAILHNDLEGRCRGQQQPMIWDLTRRRPSCARCSLATKLAPTPSWLQRKRRAIIG